MLYASAMPGAGADEIQLEGSRRKLEAELGGRRLLLAACWLEPGCKQMLKRNKTRFEKRLKKRKCNASVMQDQKND